MRSKIIITTIALAILASFAFITIDKKQKEKELTAQHTQVEKPNGITLDDNSF